MILFDPDQPEAAGGFQQLAAVEPRAVLPARQTLLKHLRASQAAVRLKGEVAVLLTTDDGIRGLNRRFRKKNKATDVLSFPAEPGFGMAGDLAISVETAARQAGSQGHALGVELRVLMLHGLLHLSGMDHETDDGAMARREAKLRARLKLPLGLIERVGAESGAEASRLSKPKMRGLKPTPPSGKTRVGVRALPPLPEKLGKDGAPGNDKSKGKSNDKSKGKSNDKSKGKSNDKSKGKNNDKSNGKSGGKTSGSGGNMKAAR